MSALGDAVKAGVWADDVERRICDPLPNMPEVEPMPERITAGHLAAALLEQLLEARMIGYRLEVSLGEVPTITLEIGPEL